MKSTPSTRGRLLYYLIPILVGLGGVAVSLQWEDPIIRMSLIVLSVSVPLFAGGNLLARQKSSRFEKIFLIGGICFLILGAGISVSGVTESLLNDPEVPPNVASASRLMGVVSLLLGLFVLLISIVRTGQDIDEMAERFWHLAEHISEGFILTTPEGTIFLVNKQFLDMSGLKEEDVLGKNSFELAEQFEIEPMQEHLPKRSKGIASEYEVSWRLRGDVRRLSFNGNPIFDNRGQHTATLSTVRDITVQHRLTQQVEKYTESLQELADQQTSKLQRSEERFRNLLYSMNEGFITLDDDNRLLYANNRIAELLGYPVNELKGMSILDLTEAQGRMTLINLLAKGTELEPAAARREINLIKRNGSMVPCFIAASSLEELEEQRASASLVITNIRELKTMQDELKRRAEELETVNEELLAHDRAKDSFLSNVSHELRTPLATIQGYVEMFNAHTLGEVSEKQDKALNIMERNIDRLLGLINEMIDFSRMEIKGIQLGIMLFSPGRLIEECVASFAPQASEKEITLAIEGLDEPLTAWADRAKMAQVLTILLNNAVKFTGRGGTVKTRIASKPNHTLVIQVIDDGIGIAEDQHKKIFEKFFQVDSTKSRRYEGTGIGLSIAKNIVEAHNGIISVSSALEKGTTFTITLPEALFNQDYDPEDTKEFNNLRILLAAEGESFRESASHILRNCGAEVTSARSGHDAVRAAEGFSPDMILISDSPMELGSASTVNLLRESFTTQDTPIIVFTSEAISDLETASAVWDDTYYVLKPFTAHVMLERIAMVLHAQHHLETIDNTSDAHTDRDPNPHVLIIDADPGFLEWVELGLHHRKIPCCCANAPEQGIQMVQQDPPDAIFLDIDLPQDQVREQLAALNQDPATQNVPVISMTGLPGKPLLDEAIIGSLHKPFTIDDMAALVPHYTETE